MNFDKILFLKPLKDLAYFLRIIKWSNNSKNKVSIPLLDFQNIISSYPEVKSASISSISDNLGLRFV